MTWILLSVPLVPLGVALSIAFAGRRLPAGGGLLSAAACAYTLLALAVLTGSGSALGFQVDWLRTAGLTLTLSLGFESLSRFAAFMVAGVALPVTLYAIRYVEDSREKHRFFAELGFFFGSMLLLVLADSLLLMFLAWEWTALASFLLIAYRYREPGARAASLRAFLTTRVGDLGFLLAWVLVLLVTGTTEIAPFLESLNRGEIEPALVTLTASLLALAAIGKSAQLPFSFWLPESMVAPTPVSALLHAATLVAAGVFLVLRLFPLFAAAPVVLAALAAAGAATALAGSLFASAERDIKRVLAWSTASQHGEMFLALGLGGPLAASFHLASHAAFKSALFLTAGNLDHCVGSRRLDELGALARSMPRTSSAFAIAALALAGVPPLSGYWSGEKILASVSEGGVWVLVLFMIVLLLAGFYVGRAGTAAFDRWPGAGRSAAADCGWWMDGPLIALAAAAVVLGVLLHGRIEELLPFSEAASAPAPWRWAAVGAALAGIGLGVRLTRSRGPILGITGAVEAFEYRFQSILDAPVRLSTAGGRAIGRAEQAFDTLAGRLSASSSRLAGRVNRLERSLDGTARGLAAACSGAAAATAGAEENLLGAGGDRFARALGAIGGALRRAQTGKLYLYTLALFLWALGLSLLSLWWWT